MRARVAARRRWPLRWVGSRGPAYAGELVALPVHNVGVLGPALLSVPAGVSAAARARRGLAHRLALELVEPPQPHTPGHDLVSAVALSMRVAQLDSVHAALRDMATQAHRDPGSMLVLEGRGGVVARIDAQAYSVVFRFWPTQAPVLVLVEELPGYAVRVDRDDSQYSRNLLALVVGMTVRGYGLATHGAVAG